MEEDLMWYLGYGSNLNRQRFLCYIKGGKPEYGTRSNSGCTNDNLPPEDRPFKIKYRLYFGLPDGVTGTDNWGKGGVAFIDPDDVDDKWTLGRIWRITQDQYEQIRDQEGREWYNREILLGEVDGIPVKTITHDVKFKNLCDPSGSYERTIIEGLMETYGMSIEEASIYLKKRYPRD
ncbi:MAG: hypothetical protein ACMUIG_08665 [Thermoplasmatota archaeon]